MGYSDKSTNFIKNDINKEFNKIDGVGYGNDDTYHFIAGINIINKYKEQIKLFYKNVNFKNNDVFQSFDNLSDRYKNLLKKCTAWSNMRDNAELLQNMSNSIDNAEKKILEKISLQTTLNPALKSLDRAVSKQKELGIQYFNRNEKTQSLELTSEVNKIAIDELLGFLFSNKKATYIIDYNKCTNIKIKNTVMSLAGIGKCIISYDEYKKTYQLRDSSGKILPQIAGIREGVSITPEAIVSYQAQKKLQHKEYKEKESLKKEGTGHINRLYRLTNRELIYNDFYWGKILKNLKNTAKNLYSELRKKSENDPNSLKNFLISTERRLDDVVLYSKKYNRKFHSEPISKKWRISGGGLMEAHLVSGSAEKDIQLFTSDGLLSSDNYNMIDHHYESEFSDYLTNRIYIKLDKFSLFDKKEDLFSKENSENKKRMDYANEKDPTKLPYKTDKLENIVKGLDLFKQMVQNIKEEYGDTWNDDDREMTSMIELLDNAIYSLANKKVDITPALLKFRILDPLQKKWNVFIDYNMNGSRLLFGDILTSGQKYINKNNIDKYFGDFASGNYDKIIKSIRGLGQSVTTLGNTYTSHLKEEIILDSKIKLDNIAIDKYFQNLTKKLQIPDSLDDSPQKKLIDNLYNKANTIDTKKFAYVLYKSGLIPGNPYRSEYYEQILEKSKEIQKQLKENQKNIDKINNKPISSLVKDTQKDYRQKKLILEAKHPKTEEEITSLQTLIYLEEHPELLEEVVNNSRNIMKDQIKYGGVSEMFKGELGHLLVDMAGGSNNAIYDDITGQGRFNLSDENSKFVGEIIQMIIEEVAFTVAVIALTATTGIGGAALIGTRIAASVGSKLSKVKGITRIIKISKKIGSGLSKTSKFSKQLNKVIDTGKILKKTNKVGDIIKVSKQADKLIDGVKVIDKAKDISQTKNLLSILKKLTPLKKETLLKDIDKMLSRGVLHQLMAKTYRGQRDDDISVWMTDMLKSSSMYGILGIVGRSAQTGVLARLGVQYPQGLHISKILVEEGMIFAGDLVVDIIMDTNPMPSWEEIIQNISIGLGAEMLPFVRGGVKKLRIGKDKIIINDGKTNSPSELLKDISESRIKNDVNPNKKLLVDRVDTNDLNGFSMKNGGGNIKIGGKSLLDEEILDLYKEGLSYEDIIAINNIFPDLHLFYYKHIRFIGIENVQFLKAEIERNGFEFSDSIFHDIDKIIKIKKLDSPKELLKQIEGYNFRMISRILKNFPNLDLNYVSRITNDSQFSSDIFSNYKKILEEKHINIYSFHNYKDFFNYIVDQYIKPELKPEITSLNISEVKGYQERINNYKEYSLSKDDYNILFMQEGRKGKYAKSHIEQGYIGDCYLIAELIGIKNKHFFEHLIRKSIKSTNEGYEITFPLGSKGTGRKIIVTKEEIDNPHVFEGELAKRANTQNILKQNYFGDNYKSGFTILEIAYNKLIADGSININKLTAGSSIIAGKKIISSDLISKSGTYKIRNLNIKDIQGVVNILSNFNSGNTIISISRGAGENLTVNGIESGQEVLHSQHAYIITGVKYINNELITQVTNPHDSQHKIYEFKLNEFLYTFDDIEYITINHNNIAK